MSLLLATTLAAALPLAQCSWNEPGHNPYRGTMSAAVDRYQDIPRPVRERLKARMQGYRYDEMVAIRRDSITGQGRYAPQIRDMHFGAGQVCASVDRSGWREGMVERGLVYCEDGHCLLVPTVCRNVSRITRVAAAAQGATPEGAAALASNAVPAATAVLSPMHGTAPVADAPQVRAGAEATGTGASFDQLSTPSYAPGLTEAGPGQGGPSMGGTIPAGSNPSSLAHTAGGSLFPAAAPPTQTSPAVPAVSGPADAIRSVAGPVDGGPIPPVMGWPFRPWDPQGPWSPWPPVDGGTVELPTPIPEPATAVLMLLGVTALTCWRQRVALRQR